MTIELVLNELSIRPAPSPREACERMADFVETVRQATKRRIAKYIRTDYNLLDLELAEGYMLRSWLNDRRNGVDREVQRFVLSLVSKAPYYVDEPLAQARAAGMEGYLGDRQAAGLLAAYLLNGLAISLRSEPTWDAEYVRIAVDEILDSGIERLEDAVHHASRGVHIVDTHHDWIVRTLEQPPPRSGADLWATRTERYPHLQFCAAVEDQLGRYLAGAEELTQIHKRLEELNKFTSGWVAGSFDPAQVGSNITPESQETLKQYSAERTFYCPDGEERTFSWHARFTPGAGRLYFYPNDTEHTITIGYIGSHLRTVLYR